jgi:protein phosphatase
VTFSTGLTAAALSDVGMRRTTNQDSHALLIAETKDVLQERGHLLMVADGMGAHAAGELASKLAADGVPHLYRRYREFSAPDALRRAIVETNSEIHRRGTANPDFHNMGTTCSVLVLLPQGALAAHIGDSRIYRLRNNTISQLTFDHSLQWELRASGQMPPGADVAAIVPKNVITRSLGPNANVQIDLEGPHPIAVGDVYLLCSDGLTGRVEDAELGAILASVPPQEAAQALIDLANLRGGPDNITVVIGQVLGADLVSGDTTGQPLRMGGAAKRLRPFQIAAWILSAACAMAAIVLAITAEPAWRFPAAGIALGAAAITALVAMVLRQLAGMSGEAIGQGRMLGNGPYSTTPCGPSQALVQKLAATLDELRSAAQGGEWNICWPPIDESCERAIAASGNGNYIEATRFYCRAISLVMKELRLQGPKKPSDSAVQL